MSDAGEGSLLQKGPLPHAPSSLPPQTFDLIESLSAAFPVAEMRRYCVEVAFCSDKRDWVSG